MGTISIADAAKFLRLEQPDLLDRDVEASELCSSLIPRYLTPHPIAPKLSSVASASLRSPVALLDTRVGAQVEGCTHAGLQVISCVRLGIQRYTADVASRRLFIYHQRPIVQFRILVLVFMIVRDPRLPALRIAPCT